MNGFLITGLTLVIVGYIVDFLFCDILYEKLPCKILKVGEVGSYIGMVGGFMFFYGAMAISIWFGFAVIGLGLYLPILFDKVEQIFLPKK